ncbi:MAG: hypothetical protein HFP77_07865 [Methylococcales symbiont of Iophon sp. n. MRB-2018]|nr:MAG: hypothetical protein HFP77_07865 [Methylococcales symbiont of Iophon sp. n. MRB-2018]KAF3980178.1 MAG: hypothetical protein HFP76_03495 [Methylococcales symbiont of Iophon sp. n. MRB-2018]
MFLLKQAGNAMAVNTVQAVANQVLEFINNLGIENMGGKQKLGSETANQ